MTIRDDLSTLTSDEIESVEKLTLRWVFQATLDFGMESHLIFFKSPDDVKDIAEDITRELLDRLPGHNVPQRIFGTVDYKKARYIILPDQTIRQALFVDSKAEKESRTATIQMSQSSMVIRQQRRGIDVEETGKLPKISIYGGQQYLSTTILLHFKYSDIGIDHHLEEVTITSIPNGLLQDKYNPCASDSIWLVGRHAPSLGEDFRVRLSFDRLKARCNWRVQKIIYNEQSNQCEGVWND